MGGQLTSPVQQDGYSAQSKLRYDLSGVGTGPWVDPFVIVDAAGNVVGASNPLAITGSFSATTQGQYLTSPPTLVNGQMSNLQVDVNGNLKIAGSFTGSTSTTYNTTPPTLTNGQTAPLQGDSNANLLVKLNAAIPAGANAIGSVSQNGTWSTGRTWTLSSGSDSVSAAQSGTWTVGLSAGANTIGGVTHPNVEVAIGGGAAPTKAEVVGGQYNSSAPTLTNGQGAGLQLDVNGNLKVTGSFASTTSVTYNTTPPTLTNGQSAGLQGDTNANLLVKVNAALPAGSNVIGAVTQSGAPWTVTWSGGTIVNAAQSGAWTVSLTGAIPTGANVIGAVTQSGGPWGVSWTGQSVGLTGSLPDTAASDLAANTTANGTVADGAYSGSGSASIISILKGIYAKLASGIAATVADGSDATQGSQADAAWSGTGSGSVVAILKSLYSKLAGTLGVITSDTTGTVSGTAIGVMGSAFSASGYSTITLQVTAIGVGGTMFLEGSWDGGTTWSTMPNTNLNALANPAASNIGVTVVGSTFIAPSVAPLLRFRLSAYTSGTYTIAYRLGVSPSPLASITNTTVSTILKTQINTGLTGRSAVISAATTNATLVAAAAHQVYSIILSNNSASWAYFKFFNKATAPVPGTDTPVEVYGIPPNASIMISTADIGDYFTLGVGYAITGAPALNDTTALAAANTIVGTILYV